MLARFNLVTADGDRGQGAGDGFTVLRIAAALMVVLAHSFPLADGSPDPTWHSHAVTISFGSAAVDIFFVVSGYLVVASWIRDPHPMRFAARRVARIWPGLLVMLVLTTWVLGSAVTSLPLGRYLMDPATLGYFVRNALLLPAFELPGVFQTNFAPGINGSVWSLPIEVTAYAGLLVFGPLLVVRRQRRLVVTAALAAGMVAASLVARILLPHDVLGGLGFLLNQGFLLFFLGGTLLYLNRRRVPMTWLLFGLATIGLVVALVAGAVLPVVVCLAYGVVFLCSRRGPGLRRVTRLGDPSYGIYIYAYPIQQLLVHLRMAPTWWTLFIEASLLSLLVGYLSWHLIEDRALTFVRRALRRPPDSVNTQAKLPAAA